jgi:molybdopterin-guanine dinucleotide biosynthesis protein A
MTSWKNKQMIAGYVLAGGGSTRFGRDKALVEFDGKPMLARMVELLRDVTKSRKVVAVREKYEAFGVAGRGAARWNHYRA